MKKSSYFLGIICFALLFGVPAFAADNVDQTIQVPGAVQPAQDMSAPSVGAQQVVGVVNINTATADQLKMLPGIDDKLASNIINYRDANGPFKSTDDLLNVSGMTKEKFNKISQNLALEGDTTFRPGESK